MILDDFTCLWKRNAVDEFHLFNFPLSFPHHAISIVCRVTSFTVDAVYGVSAGEFGVVCATPYALLANRVFKHFDS